MCALVFLGFGCTGGWVGGLISQKAYPIGMVDRVNLTPEVSPGEPMLLAQHVERREQCELVIKRIIKTSDGQRFFVKQEFEEGFGPIGGDKYILPVPTQASAHYGDAEMYSKSQSWCNLLDYIFGPSESEPWVLRFKFTPETKTLQAPPGFATASVKLQSK